MRLMPLALVSALLHAWIGWRIAPDLAQDWPAGAVGFGVLLLVSALSMPASFRLARQSGKSPATVLVVWLGLLCMGLFSSLFVLTVLRDFLLVVAWPLAWLAGRAGWEPLSLAELQRWSGAAVPLLALAATALGFWSARRMPRVVPVEVPMQGLPQALHGFTIVQISDIHVGATIRRAHLQRIVARVNTLQADMVAITGDLVDGRVADLAAHVAPLSGLLSRHGSFFVTGNHEYYSGADAWIHELRRLGIQVLVNEHVVLRHPAPPASGGQEWASLLVAGVADFSAHHFIAAHRSDPMAALSGAPDHVQIRLLLAHQPRSAASAAQAGFQLQLSGHTHGGQVWPWNHFVRFQQPFTAGLHRWQELWVYTHRGTGYWGPPTRFGVPSEIAQLRLVTAPP